MNVLIAESGLQTFLDSMGTGIGTLGIVLLFVLLIIIAFVWLCFPFRLDAHLKAIRANQEKAIYHLEKITRQNAPPIIPAEQIPVNEYGLALDAPIPPAPEGTWPQGKE